MKFGLKLFHMARYELILKQVRGIWLRIIFKPLLTPKRAIKNPKMTPSQVRRFDSNQLTLRAAMGMKTQKSTEESTARVSLAEVFHPWVCWEGPGSGFESSSGAGGGATGGVWKSGNLDILEFCLFGIGLQKPGFRTAWNIIGQKFQGLGLKLKAFILTFLDLDRH